MSNLGGKQRFSFHSLTAVHVGDGEVVHFKGKFYSD